jgi:hypothetical protein
MRITAKTSEALTLVMVGVVWQDLTATATVETSA